MRIAFPLILYRVGGGVNKCPPPFCIFLSVQAIQNFYSAKTPSIIKQIGVDQLLLETDLEDSSRAWDDLKTGVAGLASALDLDLRDVADRTYRNAMRFYFEN
jgi:Tat protein secretion system quality control protein TatD with DNase activity